MPQEPKPMGPPRQPNRQPPLPRAKPRASMEMPMATWMADVTGKLQKLQAAIDAMSAQILARLPK